MIKLNKLQGLASTFGDDASTQNEYEVALKKGVKMIESALKCDESVARRIFMFMATGCMWITRKDTLAGVASEMVKLIRSLGVRCGIEEFGTGGCEIKKV